MAFPSSPANGQTTTLSGVVYQYNSTYSSWTKVPSSIVNSAFGVNVDNFVGNGVQTTFSLSRVPASKNATMVYLNGVYQEKSTYSVSGANLTVTGIATASDHIEVLSMGGSSGYGTRTYTGTGTQTAFVVSTGQTVDSLLVFENGVCQTPTTDYTVSSGTLTFVTAPTTGTKIQIRELPI